MLKMSGFYSCDPACSRIIQNAAANSPRHGAHHRWCAREGINRRYDAIRPVLHARNGALSGVCSVLRETNGTSDLFV